MPHIVLADANNKRKETKQAGIFSLQNVCCSRVTEGRTAWLGSSCARRRGRAAGGPCWAAPARRGWGAARGRQGLATKLEMERGQKVGLFPSWLPEQSQTKNLGLFSTLFSLPHGITEHVGFFLVPFSLFQELLMSGFFLFVLK